jgi:ADP-ribosyl-[dinitrogen reductase] hydrolase
VDIQRDQARGILLGLACGDALGRPLEFESAATIERKHGRVSEMLADGTHGKPSGTVTDDTDLAMCVGRSLAAKLGFDGEDIADRFVDWMESGPFDIGMMTRDAILAYRDGASWETAGQQVWEKRAEGANAGNGSVMRCAPHAVAFFDDPPEVLADISRESSRITHADPRCTHGCALLNLTLAGFLRDDEMPLAAALDIVGDEAPGELVEAVERVPDGVDPEELESTGYVVHTLQTALYDALTADSAEEAVVTAVNRGGDTDTVGAVTGALAGARFGLEGLPDRWLQELGLDLTGSLSQLADDLFDGEYGIVE